MWPRGAVGRHCGRAGPWGGWSHSGILGETENYVLDGFPLGTGGPGGPSDPAALMGLESSLGLRALVGAAGRQSLHTLPQQMSVKHAVCARPCPWDQGQAEGPGPGVQRHRPQGPSVKGSGAVGDIWAVAGPGAVPSACRGVDASSTLWELAGRCPPSLDAAASGCKGPQPERAPSLPAPTSVDSHRSGHGEASGSGLVPQDSSSDAPGLGARAGGSCKEGLPQSRPEPRTRPAGLLSAWPLQSRRAGNLTSGWGALRRRPPAPLADLGTAAAQSPSPRPCSLARATL